MDKIATEFIINDIYRRWGHQKKLLEKMNSQISFEDRVRLAGSMLSGQVPLDMTLREYLSTLPKPTADKEFGGGSSTHAANKIKKEFN